MTKKAASNLKPNIREKALEFARGGGCEIVVRGEIAGVLFKDEFSEFIEFRDLGYNSEYGFFRLSDFPNVESDCAAETPWTIHPVTMRDEGFGWTAYVAIDGYGFTNRIGEIEDVADLLEALEAFFRDGREGDRLAEDDPLLTGGLVEE